MKNPAYETARDLTRSFLLITGRGLLVVHLERANGPINLLLARFPASTGYGFRFTHAPMTMNREYPHTADIERVLVNCSERITHKGLNYLIPRWKMIAGNFLYNDQCTVEEYLVEMDIRFWIGKVLDVLSKPERSEIMEEISLYDNELIARTFELKDCLCGEQVERA